MFCNVLQCFTILSLHFCSCSWHSHFKRVDTHLCVLSEGRRALPVDCTHPFHADEIRPNRLNHRHVLVLWYCIISRSHGFGESAKCIDGFVRLRPVTHERARVLLSVGDGNGIAELISNAPPADRGPTGHKWGDTFIAWWTQRTKQDMFISKCVRGMQPTTIYFEYNNVLIIMSCWLAVTCWC